MKKTLISSLGLILLLILKLIYKFNFINNDIYVKDDSLEKVITDKIDNYTVSKILEDGCKNDSECVLPMDYAIRSSCPYATKCIQNKCSVICPDFWYPEPAEHILEWIIK